MNTGLIFKAIRELWPMTLMLGMALLLMECALGYVLPTFASQFAAQWTQVQFFQSIIKAMIGADLGKSGGGSGGIGPELFASIAWVHPVVLAMLWAHAIITCTRVPAGEVDRGTIDVLLGLPVSRWQLCISETIVWLCGGVVIILMAVLGNGIGRSFVDPALRAPMGAVPIVVANLLCMYIAVGGMAWLLSALSDRRGRAITGVFVIVVSSFLLNYLAQFWNVAEKLAFLSVLRYYKPLEILRTGTWPMKDIAILLGVGGALWLVAGLIFARRDLATT